MTTFYLFTGDIYYPSGGVRDFKGVYRSIEEAQAAWNPDGGVWAQIALWDGTHFIVLLEAAKQWDQPLKWEKVDERWSRFPEV